ncbi:MAG: hypothetical protein ACRCRR_02250 [Rickettsia sp.]
MIKDREIIDPKSKVSSKRYVGLQSFRLLALLALVSLLPYEIPASNISLLNNIAFTLGGVVIGVFIGTAIEKRNSTV